MADSLVRGFRTRRRSEDVVQSSLSELILFLLFFFLILLASYVSSRTSGGSTEDPSTQNFINQLESLERQNSDLVAERERLMAELKHAGDQLAETGIAAAVLEEELAVLQEMLDLSQNANDDLQNQLQAVEARINALEAAIETLGSDNERLTALLQLNIGEAGQFQEQLVAEQTGNSLLEARLDEVQAARRLLDGQFAALQGENNGLIENVQSTIENNNRLVGENGRLSQQLAALEATINLLESELTTAQAALRTTDWPASLNLPDDSGYRFESGSYQPSPEFLGLFYSRGLPEILRRLDELKGEIQLIEVVGHTDEQIYGGTTSNLDLELTRFIQLGQRQRGQFIIPLEVTDNSGLGLARAAAISVLIKDAISQRYPEVTVTPLSAGQLIRSDGRIAIPPVRNFADRSRRRIEIRFRGEQ